ncbi:MAG TPA: FtsX-like permease family protein [Vicinamibacterales bacterium]|nr:FtsX-like permease family protein [Vicinamibacterales bacterium]
MILLRLISWPYFRKHVLRTMLTVAGIVLGVAVFVGMHTANQSVLFAFSNTVDRIAGKTELQVTAGETGFDEEVLDRVQSAASVGVAVPAIEAVADTNLSGQGNLLVLGVDMTGDRSLRDYDLDSGEDAVIDDPLIFLAQPDSIILTRQFATANRLGIKDTITLDTALGRRQFTVRGIMKTGGITSAFGGNLAIMDIYAAQKMFGRGRTFDRVDIGVKPGHTVADAEAELQALLGNGFQIQPPSGRGQQFEAMLSAYSMMVNISSLFALFIGMFIIYNSFAIAVTQRRSEIGILRALGATRAQIRWLFLGESAVTGVLGSIGGVLFGMLIAKGIAASIGTLINDVYGVAQRADDVATSPMLLLTALGIGIATSVVAALIPASHAARVDPVQALQKGKYQMLSTAESRSRVVLAGVCCVVSVGCLVFSHMRAAFYLGYALAVVVALLLSPMLSVALTRALRPLLKAVRPVEGALAADSLIQAPRRTSASVAAVMLSLALVVAFAGMARASYDSIIGWMETAFNPELFVAPSQSIVVRTIRFPESMHDELAAVPGVSRVQSVRDARIVFRGTPIMVVAVDVRSISETARREPVEGNAADMYARTAAGEALMVSDNLAQLQHLQIGQLLDVPAPHGTIRLPIAGIVLDYSDQQGTILMDRTLFQKYWHDDSVNVFRVYLKPGVAMPDVRKRIAEQYSGKRQVFVLTNQELKSYVLKITDQWFGLTSVQIAVAVLVAILGIVNTLTVSITDRRRELGVLQAVGGLHGQIRRTIWIEALSIGTLGLILGFILGAVNLYYILQIVHRDIAGMRLDYRFPTSVVAALVPTILLSAFVAAIWPAESAVRGSLVEALEYE